MKFILFFFGLITLDSVVPKANNAGFEYGARIMDGSEATPHSLPYQALLELRDSYQGWYCGGALISENYVLTAGNCCDGVVEGSVTLGAHRPLEEEDTQVKLQIAEIIVHEGYDGTSFSNDIAAVRLSQAVNFTDAVQPVALPSRSATDFVGTVARLSGWGLNDGSETNISEALNYIDLEVIANDECTEIWWSLDSDVMCTSGKDDVGPCGVDTGGPLVTDGVLIGIASFASVNCYLGDDAAYARITSYLDWIENNTDVQVSKFV